MNRCLSLIVLLILLTLPVLARADCGCGCSCTDTLGYQTSARAWRAAVWPYIGAGQPGAQVAIDFSLDKGARLRIQNSTALSPQTLNTLAHQIAAALHLSNPHFDRTYASDGASTDGLTLDLQPLVASRPGKRMFAIDMAAFASALNASVLQKPIGIVIDSRDATTSTLTTGGREHSLSPYWFTNATDLAANPGDLTMTIGLSWRSIVLLIGVTGMALLIPACFFFAPVEKTLREANTEKIPVEWSLFGSRRPKLWGAWSKIYSLMLALWLFESLSDDAGIDLIPLHWGSFWIIFGAALCVCVVMGNIFHKIPPMEGSGKAFGRYCRIVGLGLLAAAIGELILVYSYVINTLPAGLSASLWIGAVVCVAAVLCGFSTRYLYTAWFAWTVEGEWIGATRKFLKEREYTPKTIAVIDWDIPDAWVRLDSQICIPAFLTTRLTDDELKVVVSRQVAPKPEGEKNAKTPAAIKAVVLGIALVALGIALQIYAGELGYSNMRDSFPVYIFFPLGYLGLSLFFGGKTSANPITMDLYAVNVMRNPDLVIRTIQKLDDLQQSAPIGSRASSSVSLQDRIAAIQARFPEPVANKRADKWTVV